MVDEVNMKRSLVLLPLALLATASGANADLLQSQLPVTGFLNGNNTVTFEVTNDTVYDLTVDFTLAVIQGATSPGPDIIGGPSSLNTRTINAGAVADYTYSFALPADSITFWIEASDLPGSRDYQDVIGKDRDQWAAIVDGATHDPTWFQVAASILSDGPCGGCPMPELYPESQNPGAHIFGAEDPTTPSTVPEPSWALAVPTIALSLIMVLRNRRREAVPSLT